MAEIHSGVAFLPAGRRRDDLARAANAVLAEFSEQVLPFDSHAAAVYADIRAWRRNTGHPLAVEDGMIAATCLVAGATLATRNIGDFADLGIPLLNPWDVEPGLGTD